MNSLTQKTLEQIASVWGLEPARPRIDIPISGSPERCLDRLVIEDTSGKLFIVEKLAPESLARKQRIAETLHRLRQSGVFTVFPCLPAKRGDGESNFIVQFPWGYWQVVPYVPGIALNRPQYVYENWRGTALAAFLAEFYDKAPDLTDLQSENAFSLTEFTETLIEKLAQHDPDIHTQVVPIYDYLKDSFFPAHDEMAIRFCHGDYHPLNVIWSQNSIAAVIDWEFMGYKRELYDIANLIGCVGMEIPKSLTRELVMGLLKELQRTGLVNQDNQTYLFDFVLAQRFAWLSEWLHKSDQEMVELECVYIQLLYENQSSLQRAWSFA